MTTDGPSRGLTEHQARRSEIELMVGRLSGLARSSGLSADQRIGVCLAQKVLEERRSELRARERRGRGGGPSRSTLTGHTDTR